MSERDQLPVPLPEASVPGQPSSMQWSTAAEPEPPGGGSGGGLNLSRLMAALLRYKWLIVLILAGSTGAGVVASRFMPVAYQAEATLWIQAPDRQAQASGPIQSSGLLEDVAWLDLARSWAVLDQVVEQERLYLDYAPKDEDVLQHFRPDTLFRPGAYLLRVNARGDSVELRLAEGVLVERVAVGDSIGRGLGVLWQPPATALKPGREVQFKVYKPRDAAKRLNERLMVSLPRTAFMKIEYTGLSAKKTADVVNAVADRFIEVAAELKARKLNELSRILEEQLASAEGYLRDAQMALESFRVSTITLPSDASTPVAPGLASTQQTVYSNYFNLKIERERLARDRQALLRALSARDTLAVDGLAMLTTVRESQELSGTLTVLATRRAELRDLRQRYTEAHPLVRTKEAEVQLLERQVVPGLVLQLAGELETRVAVLDETIGAATRELRDIPPRSTAEDNLRRRVASAENLYSNLRQRYEATRLAAETTVPDVSVLDRATVPYAPFADIRLLVVLAGIAGGLVLGVALALILDRLDPRVRYPDQVTGGLQLRILGAVPRLQRRRGVFAEQTAPQVLESLRTIRYALLTAHGSAGPVSVTVSSPGSGDGKTFVTSNLALGFADLGMRTLIIDGDIRRGELHRMFEVERKPGLMDYLAGTASMEDVLRETGYANVDLLPRGTIISSGPDMLSSSRMGDLLAAIRSRYQVILIDSPPLGAGIDPLVLATLSGTLLLVLRTGRTDRALAEAKLEEIDRLPIRVLGAVLNGIEGGSVYRHYSYIPGYEATDESGEEERLLQLRS